MITTTLIDQLVFPSDPIVERCLYSDDHPEWSTLVHLGYNGDPPGHPAKTVEALWPILCDRSSRRTIFATPLSKVTAPAPCSRFFKLARREQAEWFRRLNAFLFSSAQVKREMAKLDPLCRQLEFTGVLIVEGKHVAPDRWPVPHFKRPKKRTPSSKRSLVGEVFGKLTVLEQLPKGRYRCRCSCEAQTIYETRSQRLLARRATSCGCARRKLEAKYRKRKEGRCRS